MLKFFVKSFLVALCGLLTAWAGVGFSGYIEGMASGLGYIILAAFFAIGAGIAITAIGYAEKLDLL